MSAAGSTLKNSQHQQPPTPPLSDTEFGRQMLARGVMRPVALGLGDNGKLRATVASSNCRTEPQGVCLDLASSPSKTTEKILTSATASGIFEDMFGNDPILYDEMVDRNGARECFMDYLIGRGYVCYAADLYNCLSELVNMMRFSPAFGLKKADQFRRQTSRLVACVGRVTCHVSVSPSASDEHHKKVFEKKDRMCYVKTLETRRRREDNEDKQLYVRGRYVYWAVAMALCVFVGVFNEDEEEDVTTKEVFERHVLDELKRPENVDLAERVENALCTGSANKKEYYLPVSVTQRAVVPTIVTYFIPEFDDDAKISGFRLNQRGLECCMNAFVSSRADDAEDEGRKTTAITEVSDDESLFYSSLPKLRRLLASKHWKLKDGLVTVLMFALTQTVPLSASELFTVFYPSTSTASSSSIEESLKMFQERHFVDSTALLAEYETRRGVTSDEKSRDMKRDAGVLAARCN